MRAFVLTPAQQTLASTNHAFEITRTGPSRWVESALKHTLMALRLPGANRFKERLHSGRGHESSLGIETFAVLSGFAGLTEAKPCLVLPEDQEAATCGLNKGTTAEAVILEIGLPRCGIALHVEPTAGQPLHLEGVCLSH